MLQALLRFFCVDPVTRNNTAHALCNRGKQFLVTVTEIKS